MNLYERLRLEPVRSEPDVWVNRLIIFQEIAPEPKVIREILLTRGLNIIWAEEKEDDNEPVGITGHSAGKTSFCRLMRYILGEKTFGTKVAMDLLRKAFPNGYVAAEIQVRGQKYAVRRPFGAGRMSYIREGVTIEELLKTRGRSVSQESYPAEIGLELLIDDLGTGGIVRTGETIQWGHILAWCTRDQEARFQNIYEWRSPRSESEAPAFRFPKAGPLFVMRAVLGLFLSNELEGEEKLAKLQLDKENLTKEIENQRREPQYRVNLYEHELRKSLKGIFPDQPGIESCPFRTEDLLSEDMDRLTSKAAIEIEGTIERLVHEQATLQVSIDELGAEIQEQRGQLSKLQGLFDLSIAGNKEVDAVLAKSKKERQQIQEHLDTQCPFGGVIISKCTHVIERQEILQMKQFQDVRAMREAEAEKRKLLDKLEEEKRKLKRSIESLETDRLDALAERDALISRINQEKENLRDLQKSRQNLEIWIQKRDQPGEYEELDDLRRKLESAEHKIHQIETELASLLAKHDHNRRLMTSIYSAAVNSVLSVDYDGEVNLTNRELTFRIKNGPEMSGEAVETLSVLLSDLSCLIYSSVAETAHLPGFLLHDSPREADLGLRIYHAFIRFIANLQEHFESLDQCPFQYVITTTTPPPREFQTDEYVKLRLNASQKERLLFHSNIAATRYKQTSLLENSEAP